MSYNIHHANPPSTDKIDLDTIANVIKKQNPDLVALQEVDVKTKRANGIDQAAYLAKKLGMECFFAKAIDVDGGEYGVALLSKFRIGDTRQIGMPQSVGMNGEPRTVGFARIDVANGKKLWFCFTHLDAEDKEDSRLVQMQFIVSEAQKLNGNIIFAGDLNASEQSHVLTVLDKFFARTCYNCPATFPSEQPKETIDFIAYKNKSGLTLLSHQIINEYYASDHLPILAAFQLK